MFFKLTSQLLDISGKAQLIGFIRFIYKNEITNQFLFFKKLLEYTRGQDIFDTVNSYFSRANISWEMCVGICTDSTSSMVGSIKYFISLAKQINTNLMKSFFFFERILGPI